MRSVTPTQLALSDLAAIVLLAISGRSAGVLVTVVLAVFVLTALTVAGFVGADRAQRRVLRVGWRNLSVTGVRVSRALLPSRFTDPSRAGLLARAVLYVGVVSRCLGAGRGFVIAAASLAVLLPAALVASQVLDWLRARGDTSAPEVTSRLADALVVLEPRVALYLSRPGDAAAAGYVAGVWLPVLEELPHRVVVLVREREHLDALATNSLPVVLVERTADLELVRPASITLALYPNHAARNNHLIRLPGIRDVFIGYGDSDKPASASPLARAFDEVWVAGPAGRARYAAAQVGVDDARIREVGRPTLSRVEPTAAELGSRRLTVLYAPTLEGLADEPEHCSTTRLGDQIIETLLDLPDVTVVFRPHPSAGTNDPAMAEPALRLARIVTGRGQPHRVSTEPTADPELASADVLVSDVSALVTDFIARDRPVIVTNPNGWPPDRFGSLEAVADAIYLLTSPADELPVQLERIRRGDPTSAARARLLPELLGRGNALDRFTDAVDAALSNPPRG